MNMGLIISLISAFREDFIGTLHGNIYAAGSLTLLICAAAVGLFLIAFIAYAVLDCIEEAHKK